MQGIKNSTTVKKISFLKVMDYHSINMTKKTSIDIHQCIANDIHLTRLEIKGQRAY